MDERRPTLRRWTALLGTLLIFEGVLAAFPLSASVARPYEAPDADLRRIFSSGLPILAGILALLCFRTRPSPRIWLALFWLVWGVEGCPTLSTLVYQMQSSAGRSGLLFGSLGTLLLGGAAPALWGGALRLRDHPASARLQSRFRLAAGLVQLGFVSLIVFNLWELMLSNSRMPASSTAATVRSLAQFTLVLQRLLLLGCSIVAIRTAPDAKVVHGRAGQVHRLMKVWIALVAVGAVLSAVQGHLFATEEGLLDPNGIARRTVLLEAIWLTAFAVAVLSIAQRTFQDAGHSAPALTELTPTPAA